MTYNKEQGLQEEIKQLLQEQETTAPKVGDENNQGIPSQTEENKSASEETPVISEIEKQARALGWKSKEERIAEGKDNKHYVEPGEYVGRQPLFERIERQNKDLKDLKERQRQNEVHLAQVRKEAYEQALRDLESRQDTAVAEANSDEYRRLKAQAQNLTRQMQQDPIVNQAQVQQQPDVLPEVAEFERRNASWLNTDTVENTKMSLAAKKVDEYIAQSAYMEGRTMSPREHLEAVEAEVKRMFPHRFEQAKAPSAPPVQAVGKSTTSLNTKSQGNLISRLTPQQRQLGEQFEKSSVDRATGKPSYTLEMYANDLLQMNRLS